MQRHIKLELISETRHEANTSTDVHSETPPGENRNLFARLTVRTYVWIFPDWTLQQSMAKSTER